MSQLYQQFYREVGLRRFNEMLSPRLNTFKGFPRNSVYHHFTNDDEEMFPDADKPYFHGYSKRLPMDLVYTSNVMEGTPRKLPFVPQKHLLPFIKKHHGFRYVPKAGEMPVDERTLVVVDYNPLKFCYRYVHTPISEYQKWESYQKTFWTNVARLAAKGNKNHFVIIEPFTSIPSYNTLLNFADREGLVRARLYNNHDKRFILNMVNFVREDMREHSFFNLIPKESMKKINLIFMLKDGRCSVLNLAYLYSWIRSDENVSTIKVSYQRDYKTAMKTLIKYFLVLSSSIPEDATDHPEITEAEEDRDEHEVEGQEIPGMPGSPFQYGKLPEENQSTFYQNPGIAANTDDIELSADMTKSLDDDIAVLEVQGRRELIKRGLTIKDNQLLETIEPEVAYTHDEVFNEIHTTPTPNGALKKKLDEALQDGTLNAASYKKALQDAEKYNSMTDPYGSKRRVVDRTKIDPPALAIQPHKAALADSTIILDKSMNNSVLQDYTRGYIANHHHNDILKMVGGLQKGGVTIQKHEVNIEHTVTGAVEIHNLELKPVNGVASSVWFKLPVVDDDGSFKVAGNKYLLRKQRCDNPIRKIDDSNVSLSSYYGKAFVSTENKVSNSASAWLLKQIENASFDGSEWVKDIIPGDAFDSNVKSPWVYGVISTRFRMMSVGPLKLRFDNAVVEHPWAFPKDIQQRIANGMKYCGVGPEGRLVYVDMDNHFYLLGTDNNLADIGDIYTILKLDPLDSPIRFSELALFRKNVPVGVVLGYRLGWSKLLALLQVQPRFVEPRKRLNLMPDEYPIPFLNGVYVFSRKNAFATMVLAGFMEYSKITRTMDIKDFETQDVYLNLISSKGLGAIYIREIDMLFDYFVDPITEEILKDMKEPTTFEGLLLRSTELLMTYSHPRSQDGSMTRIRGYERFSGAVYREMTAAVRQFRNKNIAGRSRIDISPYKVWQSINEDQTKMMVQDINPIQDLKNDESVTYVGEGGRSSDGINKASRSFHANDIGVVSEGTVDSSDVGVNIYTSSDPHLKNYRGLHDDVKGKANGGNVPPASRHCSAVLLAPGAIHDDQQRINFISIQSSHVIQAKGYHAPYVRTGFETAIAQRTNPLFAYCAEDDGKVLSVTEHGVIIEYKGGKKRGIEIGRQFGRSEGAIYPFDIEACVKQGAMFKKGDPIVYNTSYFEFDFWNPGKLVMKSSLTARTVLWETKETHEDANAMSKKLAEKLGTQVTYMRSFVIGFDQNVHKVATPGTTLKPQDILMIIEDETTSNLGSFGQDAIETLKGLAKQSPRSNYHGTVDRIEVFYHGDKDQMSSSLKKVANLSDKFVSEQALATNKPEFTGQVTDDYRVEGTALGFNKAEIRFYITVQQSQGVADKVVFANQMKSVCSAVRDYQMFTEAGEEIEASFGCRSIAARNVMSPYLLGTTITLLKLRAQQAVKLYNE